MQNIALRTFKVRVKVLRNFRTSGRPDYLTNLSLTIMDIITFA